MIDIEKLKQAWENLDASQWSKIPSRIDIENILPFQLANAVKMPEKFTFKVGSLLLGFDDLCISRKIGFPPKVISIVQQENNITVSLEFSQSTLIGNSVLTGKQIWHPTIDAIKGNIKTDAKGRVELFTSQNTNKNPEWIACAKAQQSKLLSMGGNGEALIGNYTEHRDALNEVFINPLCYPFQAEWACESITSMAAHTNNCLNDNTKQINDGTVYSNGNTYNENALIQEGSLLSNLSGISTKLPSGQPDPNCPYNKAIQAILSFRGNMLFNTGSEKVDSISAQTSESVYATVKHGKPAPQISMDEAFCLLSGDEIQTKDHTGKSVRMKLHSKELAAIQKYNQKFSDHAKKIASTKPVVVSKGCLSSCIRKFNLNINFLLEKNNITFKESNVLLPTIDFQLEGNSPKNEIENLVRMEFKESHFIQTIIHDRIASGLNKSISHSVVTILMEVI